MKKMVALAMCLSMAFSLPVFAEEVQEVDFYGFEEPVTLKVGFSWSSDFQFIEGEDSTHNEWADLYKENNILLDVLYEVDASQAETKFSTALMSGNYPDVFEVAAKDYASYVENGVVADITEIYEKYASDDLKAYVDSDGGLTAQSALIDGKLYGIPYMLSGYDNVPVLFLRQDWLDRLNLEAPTNLEEFKAVAHAFTYDDPDGDGKDNTYGFAVDGVDVLTQNIGSLDGFFQGFGVYLGHDGMNFMADENGKVIWGGDQSEKAKAALTALQEMYQDGSITNEFITMDGNSIFEEAGAGNVGMWFAPMWGAMSPVSNAMKKTPECHITAVSVPDFSGEGDHKTLLKSSADKFFCVSSQCEHPEALIKVLNLGVQKLCNPESEEEFFRYYSGEGGGTDTAEYKMALFVTLDPLKNYDNYLKGSAALVSGDTSELNAEQKGNHTSMEAYLAAMESGNMNAEDPAVGAGAGLYTVFGDPKGSYAAIDGLIQNDGFTQSSYQGIPTDVMSEASSTLKKLTIETIVKVITGDSVDTYDTFLENWHALGGDDVIAEAQKWADSNQ